MTTNAVKGTDKGARALLARLGHKPGRVRVGILDDASKQPHPGDEPGALTLLEVAAIHEFGAPAAGIPQRSFIRAGVDELAAEIKDAQRALAKRVVAGDLTMDAALEQLGALVAGKLQARIAAGIAPPNAPATIEKKGSSTPLIDTGQLRSSMTWLVEHGGEV